MTIRFPAQLPYDKWPAVNVVFDHMRNGLWADAQAAFEARKQDVTDAIGAGNYWRGLYTPQAPVGLPAWQAEEFSNKTFSPEVGQVYAFTTQKGGRASWTPSSASGECWISLDPGFALIEGVTVCGVGNSTELEVKAGDTVYMKWGQGGHTTTARYLVQ